jgi:hypothetical protein
MRAGGPGTPRRAAACLRVIVAIVVFQGIAGWGSAAAGSERPDATESVAAAGPSSSPGVDGALPERPEWFAMEMTDVRTGEPFTIDDFAGQVILLETMAIWCPTCRQQSDEVRRLHELLGDPSDLVSISLDTDMGEDDTMLKDYADRLGYDWRFAVAPLLVARALGNLYSAQYLNPPLSPMLVIDRDGNVFGLPYGLKSAESLEGVVSPLLGP